MKTPHSQPSRARHASPTEALALLAKQLMGVSHDANCSFELINQGGSNREFYRFRSHGGPSVVVMHYSPEKEENGLYPDLAAFLTENGVQVPRVLFHDPARHFIGLEDLGDISLYRLAHERKNMGMLQGVYRQALEQALALHQLTARPARTMEAFGEKLYHWERHYFLENLIQKWAGMQLSEADLRLFEKEGNSMASCLMKAPVCLVHRDFQSQNILLHRDKVWLIDFQGMRPGHAAYDVASLLFDPYVRLPAPFRASMTEWYFQKAFGSGNAARPGRLRRAEFTRQLLCAATQRLMQALGAYAFLGLQKGKPEFLRFIPQGLENLATVLCHMDDLSHLTSLAQRLLVKARMGDGAPAGNSGPVEKTETGEGAFPAPPAAAGKAGSEAGVSV
ncbi:MAG: phosphotransferase [Verrucomicrobiae bacterium]|nr:phosphotransferase [Verrucomicrobiae bacterium]